MTSISNASEKNSEGVPDLFAYKLANQKAMSCFLIAYIFYLSPYNGLAH
ncbi:hypothetical protein SB48_HM08orf05502 [Heyndrickxia coagulans]|uniref:Uncharacterized protein n=1 Tax=Heyndrickxia coagulans TaxID=1398 RepID=A0AAN0TAH9_HEYCO|nr:hypothetical protein SB48_HM08orf05502 [Heyndrickxia coagulans]